MTMHRALAIPSVGTFLLALLAGCSLKVVPQPVEYGTVVGDSLKVQRDGITVTAKIADIDLDTYNLQDQVTSFSVTIENGTVGEIEFDGGSFVLLDDAGHQYFTLTPEKVKEMLSRNSYYLMPYPYVGFYYLEDYEKTSFYNQFTSNLPYYFEMYPQDIYTRSFSSGAIIPRAKVSGLVYFNMDLHGKKGVSLLVFRKGHPKPSVADFTLPFNIK